MSELGAWLRESREAKGLDLADAAADTHIRRTYLEAIEEGRRKELPDPVYLRGLILSYGRYLEADPEELRALTERELGRAPGAAGRVDSHQPLSEPLRERNALLIGLVVAATILAAAALWWYWPEVREWGEALLSRLPASTPAVTITTPPDATLAALDFGTATSPPEIATATAEPIAQAQSTAPPTAVPLPTSAALPLPTPAPSATPLPLAVGATATPVATPVAGITLQARASSPAWLRVSTDGEVAFEGTLTEGEVREWFGAESVSLLTGNAGGTIVTVNGKAVEPLGDAGAIAEVTWIWDGESVSTEPTD